MRWYYNNKSDHIDKQDKSYKIVYNNWGYYIWDYNKTRISM